MKKLCVRCLAALFVLTLFVPLLADEGLWPFNMVPKDSLKAKYGFEATPEWVKHLELACLRTGGGSASFVSPDGLVLTNHHIGQGAIQNLSTKDRDLMKTGFYARTQAEELKCPGMEFLVLQGIDDVTGAVRAAEKPGMSAADAGQARDKAIAALEKENSDRTGLRCSVVTLYAGGMYHLYKYKSYTDIRLVFAPEYAIAFFGGDPDNFTYPRYDLDITLFRVYENDKPLRTPDYLKWSTRGVAEGDLVFAAGNPGSTGRLETIAQLEFLRDVNYPFAISNYQRRRALCYEYGKKGEEEKRIALRSLFGIENSLKAITGYNSGLVDPKLMAKKAAEEKSLREAVAKDPALNKEYGAAWDGIAAAEKAYASFYKPFALFERGQGFNTMYFGLARNIVRLAVEKDKPNAERLREFRETLLPSIKRMILSPSPIYDDFEAVKLADSLSLLKENAGDLAEVAWILAGRTPEQAARDIISGPKLKDPDVRKKYLDGTLEDIYLSHDSMIKLILLIDPLSRGLRLRYEREVASVETKNGALIAQALFKLRGTSIPPDATGTLRLSFGPVKGYVENGRHIPYRTTFAGLYAKSATNGNKDPYVLPESFLQARSRVNADVALNFVSTLDSIGGNSGSPVVDRKGELVGVLFDGNIQSLPCNFMYSDEVARSVMVDSRGIHEALLHVYNARPLVDEILPHSK
jgi:hypothetical protein